MDKTRKIPWIALMAMGYLAATILSGCGSGTSARPSISVVVSPDSATLQSDSTSQFTAIVTNDAHAKGVTWSVSCSTTPCGTISPTTTGSGAPTTYTAPTQPIGDLVVTITATSASTATASASVTVTVTPLGKLTIALAPLSALLPLNVSQEFTATLLNDAANKGVAWALSQNGAVCSTDCGRILPATTASGIPITYTSPASLSANPTVTLTATSVTDASKSLTATVTVTAGNVKLVPANLNFGKVTLAAASNPLAASLTNTGASPLTINSITVAGTNPGDYSQTNTCGKSLDAGNSCSISATFTPGAPGSRTAVILITDTSSDSPQQLHLSGTGRKANSEAMRSALEGQLTAAVPRPTGSSPVGTHVMRFVDSTHEDPYLSNGTNRELLVRFWYPALAEPTCTTADYSSPKVWSYFSHLLGSPLPQVTTNSCLDARVSDGAHPVVVFSHGFTGTFTDYTFLFEDLASRGYVVASVDHTYEATAVEFPDGRLEKSVFGSHLANLVRSDAPTLAFAVSVRLDDLTFVLNDLERLNAKSDSQFRAKLDLSRIAIAGHSLGGLTAILSVENEPRFKTGIVLDGVLPDYLATPTKTPILTVAAGRERWNENDCQLWTALRGPRMAVNLKGADHLTPSDALWLAKGAVNSGEMGPDKTIEAIRRYVGSFLDVNLRGEPMVPLLTGPALEYPSVTIATQSQSLCQEQ